MTMITELVQQREIALIGLLILKYTHFIILLGEISVSSN